MNRLLIPLVVVGLSACGGGGTTDPNNFVTNLGQDTPTTSGGGVTPITPTTGPAVTTTTKSFVNTGNAFTTAASSSNFVLTKTSTGQDHTATYKIVINGVTYNMTPSNGNTAFGSNNQWNASAGGNTASLFFSENTGSVSIANLQIDSGTTEDFFGFIGKATAAASLPATASYSLKANSVGEISIDNVAGSNDDAVMTNANLNVDFASANGISGSFVVADPGADGRGGGGIEIDTSVTGPITVPITGGSVAGNAFTANVDLTPLVAVTTGVSSLNTATITGGFYGSAADVAAGTSLSLGQSGAGGNDIVAYTRVLLEK